MKKEIYVLLHDIRSVHNVGSMFRTSDALGVHKIYLTGYTPTPLDRFGNKRKDIAKVALGAEESVSWEYIEDPIGLIAQLKQKGVRVVSVEQDDRSVDYKEIKIEEPTLFVFGNEVQGVEKSVLELSDMVAEIPMRGKKESLNVSVSFGVVLFRIFDK